MPLPSFDASDLPDAVASLGLPGMSAAQIAEFTPIVAGLLGAYGYVEQAPDYLPAAPVAKRSHTVPAAQENPHNAWFLRTSIRSRDDGLLAGKRVAIKDSVMVAGLPMINGSRELKGFVPEFDATVVTRLLNAGAEIVGKTHCEYFCLSGGSHTGAMGDVRNPHRPEYSAGGSSSGSAVVVSTGEVEMAIGGDQAGSIRMPASFTGVVGMKATHGLVPYTGVAPIEPMIDHVGPMTATVADNALMLEAIAGPDGLDPRQGGVVVKRYSEEMRRGISGLRIGILKEGFGQPNSESDVDAKVRAAAALLGKLGAKVTEISIPEHLVGPAIWAPVALEGLTNTVISGSGFGIGRDDVYPTQFMQHLFARRDGLAELPQHILLMMLAGEVVRLKRGHSLYGKAVNLARELRAKYDKALEQVDILLMPTTPMKATPLPPAGAGLALSWQRASEMFGNTCPFDVSHHPAISLPCAMSDGLPVGVMLVGRHFDEGTLYRAALAFEQAADWKTL
jgi:amidase